ncbi:MAG: hypothetical protein HYV09_41320 [Deltaproteobacteria bacterium]|nr:hypothetical protein [Deltaproteobacteria bacterium]
MSALSGFSVMSRRRALKVALGVAGFAVAGSTGGLVALRGRAPDVSNLRILSDHEHRTLTALAVALFPAGGAFPSGADGLDLARTFDGFLEGEPEDRQKDLQRALLLLEYGPVIFERRLRTFSNLPVDERLAHFERWLTSDRLLRRQVAVAFKKFLCIVFYDRPEVWADIGYVIAPFGAATP